MRYAARIVLLTLLWLLAWGEFTIANVVSGLAVSSALLIAFPLASRSGRSFHISLRGMPRFVVYVVTQLLVSNVIMIREVLRPRLAVRAGVLAHKLWQPSEEVVTLMSSVIALSPGTMVVDVARDSSTIYVHFLFLRDIDAARQSLVRLERLARRVIVVDPLPRQTATPTKETS